MTLSGRSHRRTFKMMLLLLVVLGNDRLEQLEEVVSLHSSEINELKQLLHTQQMQPGGENKESIELFEQYVLIHEFLHGTKDLAVVTSAEDGTFLRIGTFGLKLLDVESVIGGICNRGLALVDKEGNMHTFELRKIFSGWHVEQTGSVALESEPLCVSVYYRGNSMLSFVRYVHHVAVYRLSTFTALVDMTNAYDVTASSPNAPILFAAYENGTLSTCGYNFKADSAVAVRAVCELQESFSKLWRTGENRLALYGLSENQQSLYLIHLTGRHMCDPELVYAGTRIDSVDIAKGHIFVHDGNEVLAIDIEQKELVHTFKKTTDQLKVSSAALDSDVVVAVSSDNSIEMGTFALPKPLGQGTGSMRGGFVKQISVYIVLYCNM